MQSKHLQQIAMSLAVTACLAGMAQAQPTSTNRKFGVVLKLRAEGFVR